MHEMVRVALVTLGLALIAAGIFLFLVDVSRWWNIVALTLGAASTVLGAWLLDR